jgi:K+-transporting ATPase KdpF subunit
VTTLFWLAGILSVGLLIYLLVALFKPEKLQ